MKPKLSKTASTILIIALAITAVIIINIEHNETHVTPRLTCDIEKEICR